MKKALLIFNIILSALILSVTCFAGQADEKAAFDAKYSPGNDKVELSGNATGLVTLIVVPFGTDVSDLSDSNNPSEFRQFVCVGSLGSHSFAMPYNAPYGKYTVCITDDNGRYTDNFIYFSKADADAVVTLLNDSKSASEFKAVLAKDSNLYRLGIDTEDKNYSENVFDLMYNMNSQYTDSSDFTQKYNYCNAIYALNGKDNSEIINVLSTNESYLGINYSADFDSLDEDIKAELCNLLSDMDYSQNIKTAEKITGLSNFKAILKSLEAVASVNAANSWNELLKLYTEKFDFLKNNIADKSDYYQTAVKSDMYGEMLSMTFKTPAHLAENFETAAMNNQPKSNSSGGSSGGSGGGLSSSFSGVSIAPSFDTVPANDEVSEQISTNASFPTLSNERKSFSDISADSWYYDAVSLLSGSEIINGYSDGSFKPDSFISRAEFAKLLSKAFSLKSGEESFNDVPKESWYAESVSAAASAGIVMGDGSGNFNPLSNITREDAAVMLYRACEAAGKEFAGFKKFDDMNDISLYAWVAVGAFYENYIVSGDGNGSFMPKSNITRAQAVQIMYNAICAASN